MTYNTDILAKALTKQNIPFQLKGENEIEYKDIVWFEKDEVDVFVPSENKAMTEEQCDNIYTEELNSWNSLEYSRNRKEAYPSIEEQLDMQYWDNVNGTTNWNDAIAKVKADNPKSE